LQALFGGVPVAFGARGKLVPNQALALELAQGLADPARLELHYRVAAAFLVAGGGRGVERQRVGVRGGRFLFHQTAQHTCLHCAEANALWFFGFAVVVIGWFVAHGQPLPLFCRGFYSALPIRSTASLRVSSPQANDSRRCPAVPKAVP